MDESAETGFTPNHMKPFLFVCAALLFLAVARMPAGYYVLLRIVITIGSLSMFFLSLRDAIKFWPFLFGLITVLFNPVVPVHFHDSHAWATIYVGCAILFAVKGLTLNK